MSESSTSKLPPMEAALIASHKLLTTTIKRPTARSCTSPPSIRISSSVSQLTTPGPQTPRKPATPTTSRQPLTPATPRAPRKRSLFDYETTEPITPTKRTRTTPSTPDSTPSKPHRGRKKQILQLDRVICIPMHVLRAQVDDTSALLRPLPRPSDRLRKLVDLSVERVIQKLRAPGCTGILDAAVWMPGKKDGVMRWDAASGSSAKKRAGGARKAKLVSDLPKQLDNERKKQDAGVEALNVRIKSLETSLARKENELQRRDNLVPRLEELYAEANRQGTKPQVATTLECVSVQPFRHQ